MLRSLLLLICAAGFAAGVVSGAGLPEQGVSHDLARDRAGIISNVHYQYNVQLAKGAETMPGRAIIRFDLASPTPIVLDFRDGEASNMTVNGVEQPFGKRNGHLTIPGGNFRAGANRIELDFASGIATANRAITRFNDTADGAEYLYTLFVPMDADQAFPCFDQPDLKATFTLNLTAPSDWKVVSNTAPTIISSAGALNIWHFAETRPISTYLFAFAAGPFEVLESGDLHLYARKSQAARAKEEWPRVAETVRQGMTRLSAYFAQPFPFPKYDEVLIPGFAYGGMEHAGATFLNEDTVLFRTTPTVNDYNRRDNTVLHELAHQWFGDLVTMRWFDDLWLKEGFAQFMAFHTQADMAEGEQAKALVWKRFYESIKPAAYGIDSTHGTTPIYQQIVNLKDAKSAYGAIVYEKAPSLLKLLDFNLGDEHFRDGIRIFLKEHAYANATWSDLIGALSRASGTDLAKWADAWVEQRGMPQVEASWSCGSGRILRLTLRQSDSLADSHNAGHLWPMRMVVLLHYPSGESARVTARLEARTTVVREAMGKSCPDYVFANDADNAYGRFLLDLVSRKVVAAQIGTISDPFLRSLLWGALWDNMRELRMPPEEYAELAMRALPGERDPELAVSLLGRLRGTYTDYLSDGQRGALAERLENLLIDQFTNAPTKDLRITYFRGFIGIATTAHGKAVLNDLLTGKVQVPEVTLTQRDRWNIVTALTAGGDPSAPELIAAERKRDTTSDGPKYEFVAGAAAPTAENKKKYFSDFVSNPAVTEDWITSSLNAFNRWNQTGLTLPYLKPALDALPQMKQDKKIFFVLNWLGSFVGNQDSAEALKITDDFLARNSSDADLRLKVLEVRDELARTVRIRAHAANLR